MRAERPVTSGTVKRPSRPTPIVRSSGEDSIDEADGGESVREAKLAVIPRCCLAFSALGDKRCDWASAARTERSKGDSRAARIASIVARVTGAAVVPP